MAAGRRTKDSLKRGVKRIARLAAPFCRLQGARILTYHSVGHRDHEMNVTPEAFRDQMAWLAEHARLIPLDAAQAGLGGVAVTFDDGYRDNLINAVPILEEVRIPATFFIVAGRVGGILDHDSEPETSALMTWDEVRQLESLGFAIGAHTLSHPRLSRLNEEEQRAEIEGSAHRLEKELGHPIDAFAYPFGSCADYDDVSERLVRESGFAYAVSNRYGVNLPGGNPWALRRIWIDATDNLDTFQAKVTGELDALFVLDSRLGVLARRMLNCLLRRG